MSFKSWGFFFVNWSGVWLGFVQGLGSFWGFWNKSRM